MRPKPAKDEFLFKDDDPCVIAELERREKGKETRERQQQRREQDAGGEEGEKAEKVSDKGEKWKDLHMTLAEQSQELRTSYIASLSWSMAKAGI